VLLGRHDQLKHLLQMAERKVSEDDAGSDEAFETFSEQLHQHLKTGKSALPSALAQALTQPLTNTWKAGREDPAALRAMGVRPRPPTPEALHVSVIPDAIADLKAEDEATTAAISAGETAETPARRRIDPAELARFKQALGGDDGH
jgi:hypothetical protein